MSLDPQLREVCMSDAGIDFLLLLLLLLVFRTKVGNVRGRHEQKQE